MKNFSLRWLLRGKTLSAWLARAVGVLIILTGALLLLRSEIGRSADQTRAARVSAKNAEIRSDAVTNIQQQLRNYGSLIEGMQELIPPLSQVAQVTKAIGEIAQEAHWGNSKVERPSIVDGSPAGADISTVRFLLRGDTTADGLSIVLGRLQHAPFLLRVDHVSWQGGKVDLSGEFYVRK